MLKTKILDFLFYGELLRVIHESETTDQLSDSEFFENLDNIIYGWRKANIELYEHIKPKIIEAFTDNYKTIESMLNTSRLFNPDWITIEVRIIDSVGRRQIITAKTQGYKIILISCRETFPHNNWN